SEYIGHIDIHESYSTVDLPEGMPKEIFKHLKTVWVCGQRLQISLDAPAAKPTRKQGASGHKRTTPNTRPTKKRGQKPKKRQ
ncbi:MAG: DbpA RNA binding domain-containing protein, partial [Halioglobus sp.]